MSRRTAATIRRPAVHVFIADPDDAQVCATCQLIERNDVHQLPDPGAAARDRDAAVLGERTAR